MTPTTLQTAPRAREYVSVVGADAAPFLGRMLSNDVEALVPIDSCEALLLTPKARLIAPLVVVRFAAGDFLLLTEPGLGQLVARTLLRARLRSHCVIEVEEHRSDVVLGLLEGGPRTDDYGVPAVELIDTPPPVAAEPLAADVLELLRIRAGTPRWGAELDDRVLPAEARLEERFISFTKGCYPGQEPVARLHYRGRPNRLLQRLTIAAGPPPPYDAPLFLDGKDVGRVTSAADDGDRIAALGYVRREVTAGTVLLLADGREVVPAFDP